MKAIKAILRPITTGIGGWTIRRTAPASTMIGSNFKRDRRSIARKRAIAGWISSTCPMA